MLRLGAHESIGGGLFRALERAESVGCESLQLWTKNSRQWSAPPLDDAVVVSFREACDERSITPIVAHASYLINLASPNEALYRRSIHALVDEARRCERLAIPYLVLHPGAHTGSGVEAGNARIVGAVEEILSVLPHHQVRILFETTAGQGTVMGADFEGLAALLGHARADDNLGVCLDTCHVFAAGYEIRTAEGYEDMMSRFDVTVGLDRLYVIHINDSRHPLGSRKDRHEHIGEGEIGLDAFAFLLDDPRLDGLPGILETPKSEDLHEDRENLARLRTLVNTETEAPRRSDGE